MRLAIYFGYDPIDQKSTLLVGEPAESQAGYVVSDVRWSFINAARSLGHKIICSPELIRSLQDEASVERELIAAEGRSVEKS